MRLHRILAPTDFSRSSGFALEWAANLAEALRADLILLHVVSEEEGRILEEVIGEGAAVQVPPDGCTPGTHQCSDNVPQTCDGGGRWQDGATCPYVCAAGVCGGACVPGAQRCS